jgi:hypothetical protein
MREEGGAGASWGGKQIGQQEEEEEQRVVGDGSSMGKKKVLLCTLVGWVSVMCCLFTSRITSRIFKYFINNTLLYK